MFTMRNTIYSLDELNKLPSNGLTDYYFSVKRKEPWAGWKIHLFMGDRRGNPHPTMFQDIIEYLIENNLEHKYGNGCDDRTLWIYPVGNRDDAEKVAKDLDKRFGNRMKAMSSEGAGAIGDTYDYLINLNIGMRYDGLRGSCYGSRGVPRLIQWNPHTQQPMKEGWVAKTVLKRELTADQEKAIQLLAGHMMLAKHCGTRYLGKDYTNTNEDWDKFLYNSKDISSFSAEEIEKVARAMNERFNHEILLHAKSKEGIEIRTDLKLNCAQSQNQMQEYQKEL